MADTTQFAGLERLNVGEPLTQEFLYRNPTIIDALLQVGAVTHRHDAHAKLDDPVASPTAVGADTGGTIPADTSLYVAHALVDADGGETLMSAPTLVTTDPGLPTPDDGPTLAVDTTAGTLLANTYYYALTVVDGTGGETALGPASTITIDPGFPTARIQISGLAAILTDVGGTEWRMWRAVGSGDWHLLNMGSGDTMTDDGTFCADASLQPPDTATTHSTNKLTVTVPGPAPAGAVSFNLYLSVDGSFSDPSFIATHPIADIGAAIEITSLTQIIAGAPPAVSLTLPGANKIDPDTELVDWHWKRPVATVADLPAVGNDAGDVRAVTATGGLFYTWDGDSWNPVPTGAHVITDGSSDLPPEARLAFEGAGVTVADDAANGQTVVTIPGGGGADGPPHVIQDEGADLTQRSKLDFVGGGVTATDDAANDRTVVTIPGATGGGGTGGPMALGDSVTWNDAVGNPAVLLTADDRIDQDPMPGVLDITAQPDGQIATATSYDIASAQMVPHNPANGGGVTAWETLDRNEHLSGFDAITHGRVARSIEFPTTVGIYRLGIGLGGGDQGIFAWLASPTVSGGGAWKLQIVGRITSVGGGNNENGYVVVGTADLPAAPSVGDYLYMNFILNADNTVTANLNQDGAVLAEVPNTALPADIAAVFGVSGSGSKFLSTADRWASVDGWATDALEMVRYSEHREIKATITPIGGGAVVEEVLFDDTWNRSYASLPVIGVFGADWTDVNSQVWVDERRVWHLSGKVHKTTGAAPVDGEVIFTFSSPHQPGTGAEIRPVVTGDADGVELGMVEFDGTSQLVWRAGRSTDPATKAPYVRFDGYDIEGL